MEVVGGVGSVVGILAFTGQALKGLIALKQILRDVAGAKVTVQQVLEAMTLLEATIVEVEQVIKMIDTVSNTNVATVILETSALDLQVRACQKEIKEWVILARKLDPTLKKGFRAFLKRLKVVSGEKDLKGFAERIASHQQRIGISISLLGRYVEVPFI